MTKRVLVLTLIALLAFSLVVFGAKAPKDYKMLRMLERAENGVYPDENVVSRYLTTPESKLIPLTAPVYVAGFSYYDYQANDGARRQVARGFDGTLHFTWMNLVGNDMTNNRYMDYNAKYNDCDLPASELIAGGTHVTSAVSRGGYGGLDILPADKAGREVLCYHLTQPTTPAQAFWGTVISIERVTAGLGQFNQFDIPDSVSGSGDKGEWPALGCSKVMHGDTAFMHITHAKGSTSAGAREIGYVRCFEKPSNKDTLVCQSPGWGTDLLIQKATKLVPNKVPFTFATIQLSGTTIATSPSGKVAIVWLQNWVASQTQNELYYEESTNDGSDWITSSANFTPIKLTSYQGTTTRAYDDLAAVYDYNNNLHIMWTTFPSTNSNDVSLWHWSAATGIRKAGSAFAPSNVDPGAWNVLIAKFSLGVEYVPTDTAYNYLYFNYTKFVDGDVAADEFANGDLYKKVSSNGGQTWGPEVNLTNSNTNGCAPPACSSEHWSSIAERVDDFEYVSYILDHDAGGVPQSEGTFTLNEYALLCHPRELVPAVPSKSFSPGSMETPVRWAKNGLNTTDTMLFDNVGTTTLQVQLSGPAWMTLSPASFSIIEAGPTQIVSVGLSGAGKADTFVTGEIKILSNNGVVGGGPNFNDTEYVKVNFVVTDTFYIAEFDTCKRGPRLVVSNVGNIGAQSDSAGMFYNGLNYLFDGSPLMVTQSSPAYTGTNKGYSWIHSQVDMTAMGHLVKNDYANLKTTAYTDKFALNNWKILESVNFNAHWAWLGWTKWSKIVQFDWVPGKLHAVIYRNWWVAGLPPKWWMDVTSTAPVGGYFGIGGDWDVTASFSGKDLGGIIDSLNLAYLYQDTVNSNKWYGGYQMLGAYVTQGTTTNYTVPFALHVGNNATQMYPFQGYDDDSLWKYMSMPGDFIEQDSAQDMNVIISAVEVLSPTTSTEIGLTYTAIVSDSNLADFVRQANFLKKEFIKNPADVIYHFAYGDANGDFKVTVSDVVYLVNYLFKGGPEPWLLMSDVNADDKVTVSDVVYLVNYLFKGGPAPLEPNPLRKPF
jgi:hypothetical protein